MGFEKPAEGQIRMPETPSQNPTGKGKDRQSIKNKGNHKFLSIPTRFAGQLFPCAFEFFFRQPNRHGQLKQDCSWRRIV
jgi:hypothetical protein